MLQARGLSKHFAKQTLFEDVSFALTKGEKVGLVGKNGSGKSTLFRILLGQIEPDSGEIIAPKGYRLGSLPQHIHFTESSLLAEACLALGRDQGHESYRVKKILMGLGFSEDDFDRAPSFFSGGFQIRINLAKALVQGPNCLLLDEPTNYLDIVSQRWLANYLKNYEGEIIAISHDRQFMDSVTNHTMGIQRKQLRKLMGSTGDYYERLRIDDETYEKSLKNQEQQIRHMERYISRFRYSARRASQAQSRIKKLEKMESMVTLGQEHQLKFEFHYSPCSGKNLLQVNNLHFHYEGHRDLIADLKCSVVQGDRIGIIGKNGKGKSTLLNLLAGLLAPTEGTIRAHPSTLIGHFGQTNINHLHDELTVMEEIANANSELKQSEVRTICGIMMFTQDHALKKIKQLSGGERSRVLLGKILAQTGNLILLDEPTNHLDQESVEALIEGIEKFPGAVLIVTHNERILHHLANKLIVFHRGRVEYIEGNYDYFLRKYGWEEDGGISTQSVPETIPVPIAVRPSKRDLKKLRSALVLQKSKTLNPLKLKIDQLELNIQTLEQTAKDDQQAVIEASQQKEIERFVVLSKRIRGHDKEIETLFRELEKATLRYEAKKKEFEEKLLALASGEDS